MSDKVIEFKGLDALVELAREVILLVKEMAREKRIRLQVEGNQEVVNLSKDVSLRDLRLKKMELELRLHQIKPSHEKMILEQKELLQKEQAQKKEIAQREYERALKQRQKQEAKSSSPKGAQANRNGLVKVALKEGTKPVTEGAVVSSTEQQGAEAPLTHKFPPLEQYTNKP